MSSEDYYRDNKYPFPSHGDGGQSSMLPAPAPYAAYYAAYNQTAPSGHETPYRQRNGNQYPPESYYGAYQHQGCQHQPPPPYYQQPAPPAYPLYQDQYNYGYPPSQQQYQTDSTPQAPSPDSNDRGALGALAGGAAGAYSGHQVNHGILGTIGGAIAGSLAEDAIKLHGQKPDNKVKKEKKEKKSRWGFHRRGTSSSSSSSSLDSDYEKEDHKPKPKPVPAPAPAPTIHRGNFSHSSSDISLQGNHELVASCCAISGRRNHSRLPLSSVLTNEFGHFKWKRNGNFGASARNARLTEGGCILEAELADGSGGWRRDWVRLDERISNRDGVLVFLD